MLRLFQECVCMKYNLSLFKAGHVCGDNIDLVKGQPTGSVRVSFGYMSTFEDCQKFLNFVADCFVEKPVKVDQVRLEMLKAATASQGSNEDPPVRNGKIHQEDDNDKPTEVSEKACGHRYISTDAISHEEAYTLTNIYIYPIKSCGAYEV